MKPDLLELAKECGAHVNEKTLDVNFHHLENLTEFVKALEVAKLEAQPNPVSGVVLRNGYPTLLADKHIKNGDERLYKAAQPVGVPAGMKLVPLQCTKEMANAAWQGDHTNWEDFAAEYSRAIAAAPALPVEPVPEHCMCAFCKDGTLHASDCAVHNKGVPEMYGSCDCGATPAAPAVELQAVSSEMQIIVDFLLGLGPLNGVWFGEHDPNIKGAFWWRRDLKIAWLDQTARSLK